MPCYLFTYHGHATWMPDRPQGYVHRQRGLQPCDDAMADNYLRRQREPEARFSTAMQQLLVDTARNSGGFIDATVHAVATEPTHVHVLISWSHRRAWKSMRSSVRRALSTAMNTAFARRAWFSDSPSRRRVRDHFDFLIDQYLPDHSGVKWFNLADAATARRNREARNLRGRRRIRPDRKK